MAKHQAHTTHQPAQPEPAREQGTETTETTLRRWEVSLAYLPTRIVEAKDEDGAWEAYKVLMGIIASDHKPKIVEVKEAPEVPDHGNGPG